MRSMKMSRSDFSDLVVFDLDLNLVVKWVHPGNYNLDIVYVSSLDAIAYKLSGEMRNSNPMYSY